MNSAPVNFIGLRLYHETDDPVVVSNLLKRQPSRSQIRGDRLIDGMPVPLSGWFLDFEGAARNFEQAIDALVDTVRGQVSDFLELRSCGWEASIRILIDHRIGYTGRLFTAEQMRVLGEAGIDTELWIFAPTPGT